MLLKLISHIKINFNFQNAKKVLSSTCQKPPAHDLYETSQTEVY